MPLSFTVCKHINIYTYRECLSRQPSLVINIVGPTTLTGCRVMLKGCCESRPWKGGGRHDTGNPPLLQLFHVCHLSLSNIEMLGGRRPQTDRRGRHNTLQPSGCFSFTFLSPPFLATLYLTGNRTSRSVTG